jgi:predicted membrane channel-forming protein YqfA (hemolysin III family)
MFCLTFSGIYHLFKDKDIELNGFLVRFDYAGIFFLIAGAGTPPIYYTFLCEEINRNYDLFLIFC